MATFDNIRRTLEACVNGLACYQQAGDEADRYVGRITNEAKELLEKLSLEVYRMEIRYINPLSGYPYGYPWGGDEFFVFSSQEKAEKIIAERWPQATLHEERQGYWRSTYLDEGTNPRTEVNITLERVMLR